MRINSMKIKITTLIFCCLLLACSKKANLTFSETLTGCPANAVCTYNYTENTNSYNQNQLINGNYKVFTYNKIDTNNINIQLFFKTSLSNNEFVINSAQIAAGNVAFYNVICISCNVLPTRPVGGEIKGKKTDPTHWLINASVVLGNSFNKHLDTVKIIQYYTPQVGYL